MSLLMSLPSRRVVIVFKVNRIVNVYHCTHTRSAREQAERYEASLPSQSILSRAFIEFEERIRPKTIQTGSLFGAALRTLGDALLYSSGFSVDAAFGHY